MIASTPAEGFSRQNCSKQHLYVWLEPWAEEYLVPPNSLIEIAVNRALDRALEIDETAEQITIYAPGGSTVVVRIDGTVVNENHASFDLAVPHSGNLSTKGFINVVFGDFPETRPGGIPAPDPISAWRRWLNKVFRF